MDKTVIDIIGSCVSRDTFRLCPRDNLSVGRFFARTTIRSAISSTDHNLAATVSATPNGTSNFEHKMFLHDVRKDMFRTLAEANSKFVLVDFIDERHDVYERAGRLLVNTEALRKSAPEALTGYRLRKPLADAVMEESVAYLRRWCGRLKLAAPKAQFILHRALWASEVRDVGPNDRIFAPEMAQRHNELLNRLYDGFVVQMAGRRVHQVRSDQCVATCSHKWGYGPYHYIDAYYEDIMEGIVRAVELANRPKPAPSRKPHARKRAAKPSSKTRRPNASGPRPHV